MNYHVLETIALGEEMTRQQAEDYAKVMAAKHPASTYHVVQSVGRTKHQIGFEWDKTDETISGVKEIYGMKIKINNKIPDNEIHVKSNEKTLVVRVGDSINSDTPSSDMDGYRSLIHGEEIDYDLDEFDAGYGFKPYTIKSWGMQKYDEGQHYPHRRKITKPEQTKDDMDGYRLLEENEFILNGDEFYHDSEWVASIIHGQRVQSHAVGKYRRKIK